MRPGGIWISFSTVIAVTVLPQPELADDAQRLAAVDGEVHAVDRANHAVVGPEVGLQSADLEQPLSHASHDAARIERIAQAVADEVDGEHREEDRAAGEQCPVRRDVELILRVEQDAAPGRECPAESQDPGTTGWIRR